MRHEERLVVFAPLFYYSSWSWRFAFCLTSLTLYYLFASLCPSFPACVFLPDVITNITLLQYILQTNTPLLPLVETQLLRRRPCTMEEIEMGSGQRISAEFVILMAFLQLPFLISVHVK